jgi:hypothetical protein
MENSDTVIGFHAGQMVHVVTATAAGDYYCIPVRDVAKEAHEINLPYTRMAKLIVAALLEEEGITENDVTLMAALINEDGVPRPDIPLGTRLRWLVEE